jgi:ABC-2 type transport system ATP-binding protein
VGFQIDAGELVGYIGPNGAGKSTTVKIMSGILTPDGGVCSVGGRVPWKERVAHVSRIGVVFGQRSQLWWDVPVSDSFDMLREMYGVSNADYRKRIDELCGVLDIGVLLKTPVRQLSLGQRIRCELAASLLHLPKILFLDEPTIGLDAVSKLSLRKFLLEMNREHGITMILTTHDMDDIEALCRRVMVIGKGSLLYDGGLENLKETYAPLRRVRAKLSSDCAVPAFDWLEGAEIADGTFSARFDPRCLPAEAAVAKLAGALPLRDIVLEEADVDEMIAEMYREMCL